MKKNAFFEKKILKRLHSSEKASIFAPQLRNKPSSLAQSVRASDC